MRGRYPVLQAELARILECVLTARNVAVNGVT
jgi:hypothetical protein